MKVVETGIQGLAILEPKVFGDDRGFFFESFNEKLWKSLGFDSHFVQDNISWSRKGVLRGLHFQTGVHAQAKLVSVVHGAVLDVAVDLRKKSPTFKKSYAIELSAENKRQLYIPRGFAHGFLVLSDEAVFTYKCDNFYQPSAERGILFDDPDLAIDWKMNPDQFVISEKDRKNQTFKSLIAELGE